MSNYIDKHSGKISAVSNNKLIMTNFLLADTSRGSFPCRRYESIESRIAQLGESDEPATLKSVGNAMEGAVQPPGADESERVGGTLYTTFINISDMEFVLVYKLDNQKLIRLDLTVEFTHKRKRKIKL